MKSHFSNGGRNLAQKSALRILYILVCAMNFASSARGDIPAPTSSASPHTGVVTKGNPDKLPNDLQDVGVVEHLSSKLDLENLMFTDSEDGKLHALKEYFQTGKPVLLNLVYYECPMLCTMVLNGVTEGLKGLDWSIGKEFNVITISINPLDDTALGQAKRELYVKNYSTLNEDSPTKHTRDEKVALAGWKFFTGTQNEIKLIADQLGFSYNYDKIEKQYAHPAVTFILTPEGKISRYLYGIQVRPRDVRLALNEAAQGKIGNVFDRILMFCYHYEPSSRGYALHAVRVMQLGGAGTVALLGGWLTVFWTRQRKKGVKKDTGKGKESI